MTAAICVRTEALSGASSKTVPVCVCAVVPSCILTSVRPLPSRSAAVAGSVVLLAVVVLSGAAVCLTSPTAVAQRVSPEDAGKLFLVANMPDEVTVETSESEDSVWVILPETKLKLKRPPYRQPPRPRSGNER